ncbi:MULTISPECIES: DinB family protein [unclassified Bacillus cereus group]|uniref:DinB family protein n=1 Tax=unclassified Bacillus cereus group TaxID=2750818 RepID=UPI001F595ECA|nr:MULTISPECIES: DinB family protein [unclassified Bacillus cereus group]
MFVQAALHQLKIAIHTSIKMLNPLTESDLNIKPIQHKRSLFEMYAHLSLICHADLLILNETPQEELQTFYRKHTPKTIHEIQQTMLQGYDLLSETFLSYSHEELAHITTAYWGVSYSRFEWLLEIIAHVYHHRAQIHILVTEHIQDPSVALFE